MSGPDRPELVATARARRVEPALLVILAGVVAALHIGKLPPAIPVLRDALGLTLVQAGFLLSLVQLAGMTLGVVFGVVADSLGSRRSMTLGLVLLLHGAYYAATDGVIAALISGATPAEVRASGLAALNTATSLTRLAGSVIAGVIWSWQGPGTVVTIALIAAAATMIVSAIVLRGAGRPSEAGTA